MDFDSEVEGGDGNELVHFLGDGVVGSLLEDVAVDVVESDADNFSVELVVVDEFVAPEVEINVRQSDEYCYLCMRLMHQSLPQVKLTTQLLCVANIVQRWPNFRYAKTDLGWYRMRGGSLCLTTLATRRMLCWAISSRTSLLRCFTIQG